MVSKNLTYAQHCLMAFCKLMENQSRKTEFRITYIKTQAKNNATKMGIKLGPNCDTYFRKAILGMVDNGILVTGRSRGSYAFSPLAKRQLAEGRRVLSNVQMSPDHKDRALSDHVLRGIKRAGDDIEATPSKRQRRNSVSVEVARHPKRNAMRSIPSKKSMQALGHPEVTRDQSMEMRAWSRSPSPLTDLDDDDEVENEAPGFDLPQTFNMLPRTREQMPVENPRIPAATPVGLNRTSSLFSTKSQQATPPASNYGDDEGFRMDYSVDASALNEQQIPVARAYLATPGSSPIRGSTPIRPTRFNAYPFQTNSQCNMDSLSAQLAVAEEENRSLRAEESGYVSTISVMNGQMRTLQERCVQAEAQLAQLDKQKSTLEASLDLSVRQRSELEEQCNEGATAIASLQQSSETKDQTITTLGRELQDIKEALNSRTHDLHGAQQMFTEAQEQLITLQSQVEARENESALKLAAIQITLQAVNEALHRKTGEIDQLQSRLKQALETVGLHETALEQAKTAHAVEVEQDHTRITSLEASLSSAEDVAAELRADIGTALTGCHTLQTEVKEMTSEKTRLMVELETERGDCADVKAQLEEALGHLHEKEVELQEMEELRTIDARTIKTLRDTFVGVQAAQMQHWAEIPAEVTQASPAPRRSRFSL
ncbi:hypothetical protein BDP27DRAFT_1312827 [Rhodocollybia butyracea]|uniref:Uncharacterized protein n=1 Tax=Rhodocollybia butyracea TaxID=206335 RepID=A0A9P5Q934_9AGAR|nr:hypothetical protein BDP27DRAFT_1312827 [Rhodocollybia butyracea]